MWRFVFPRTIVALYADREQSCLGELEGAEVRHRRTLARYSVGSIAAGVVFLVADYVLLPELFRVALIATAAVAFLLSATLFLLVKRRSGAAEWTLLAAFVVAAVMCFWLLRQSHGEAAMLQLYGLGVSCFMLVLCSAFWGLRVLKAIACFVVVAGFHVGFVLLTAEDPRVALALAALTITYAGVAVLSHMFSCWNERAFLSEEQRLLTAISAGRHTLWAFDIRTGRAENLRPRGGGHRWVSGLSFERYLSRVHPGDVQFVRNCIAGCIEGNPVSAPAQFRAKPAVRGDYVWFEGFAEVVEFDTSGEPQTLLVVINNIADQKQLTRKLEQQSDQLMRSTSKRSDFLAVMSHEIRTPLTGILGSVSLLADARLTARQLELIGIIQASGNSLLQVLNDVLDYSKIEAGKLTLIAAPFRVREVAEHCIGSVTAAARQKSIPAVLSIDDAVPEWVQGDAIHLSRILEHLLGNAVKYSDSGTVTLGIRSAGADESGACRLRFVVEDQGMGIAVEMQANLFSPFTHVQSAALTGDAGIGLGLAVCKRLVDGMTGTIACSSAPDAGTTFTVEIPFQALEITVEQSEASPDPVALWNTREILVAEDNPVNQRLMEKMLAALGYRPRLVHDGEAACEAVRQGFCGAILMDCEMPVLDGIAATRLLRRLPAGRLLPVIGTSAHRSAEYRAKCLEAGMSDYLEKPVTRDAVEAVLSRWYAPAGHCAEDPETLVGQAQAQVPTGAPAL